MPIAAPRPITAPAASAPAPVEHRPHVAVDVLGDEDPDRRRPVDRHPLRDHVRAIACSSGRLARDDRAREALGDAHLAGERRADARRTPRPTVSARVAPMPPHWTNTSSAWRAPIPPSRTSTSSAVAWPIPPRSRRSATADVASVRARDRRTGGGRGGGRVRSSETSVAAWWRGGASLRRARASLARRPPRLTPAGRPGCRRRVADRATSDARSTPPGERRYPPRGPDWASGARSR